MTTADPDGARPTSCSCPQDGVGGLPPDACSGPAGAVGALAAPRLARPGSLVHTQVAYAGARLHRRHPGGAQPPRRLRRALGGRTGRRPGATSRRGPRSASRRRGRSSSTAGSACTRRSAPLLPLYQAGTFAAVHAVGQLNPTRSHFAAMEDMERAAPGSSLRTGWLDRMVGLSGLAQPVRRHRRWARRPPRARSSARAPRSRCGRSTLPALRGRHRGRAGALGRGAPRAVRRGAVHPGRRPPWPRWGCSVRRHSSRRRRTPRPTGATYPAGDLGNALRDVARLIKSGVGAAGRGRRRRRLGHARQPGAPRLGLDVHAS